MAKRFTEEDDALLAELGVEAEKEKASTYTPRQERIVAGFEEIQRFVQEHGRRPQHGENRDIFERLYAVRLDRIRASTECMELLRPLDADGLLDDEPDLDEAPDEVTDDELLAALGVDESPADDITQVRHVRPQADRNAAEEVARRKPCEDFEKFRPLFDQVQRELAAGLRHTARFQHNGRLDPGDLFILDGQKVLVAEAHEAFMKEFGREDRRLRVIFDNGTESNLLLRSLQRAMYKDENGRRILPLDTEAAPLFSDEADDGDLASGTIYVLRSKSDHPFIAEHRKLIHKIGVTGGDVERRVANARKDPTYLLADVEIVATFTLANVNRKGLESLLHRLFAEARLDVDLKDRFGSQVEPREWFFVPWSAIDEAIQKIKDGTIDRFRYDPEAARLAPV